MLEKVATLFMWLVVATLSLVLPASLMAQTAATGAIKGTVTDSSGAVVPNVTVAATNNGTGVTRTVITEADGSYIITLLPLGSYKLKFDATGFKPGEVASVTVNVTETAVLNPVLEVGSQTQEVTVKAEAEEVQTSNPTMGDVVASTTATTLPLTTRNYTNLLGLSAGANASVFNATALGKGTTDIAVNGSSTYQNSISMDGVSIVNNSANGLLSDSGNSPGLGLVNPDAIQEFKIQTSLFDAGYGRKVGASVNVVTKSGTNDFHGSAFEFFRNTVLNANDFFRKESPAVNGVPNDSRQVLTRTSTGGCLAGRSRRIRFSFSRLFKRPAKGTVRRLKGTRRPVCYRFSRVVTVRIPRPLRRRWEQPFARGGQMGAVPETANRERPCKLRVTDRTSILSLSIFSNSRILTGLMQSRVRALSRAMVLRPPRRTQHSLYPRNLRSIRSWLMEIT